MNLSENFRFDRRGRGRMTRGERDMNPMSRAVKFAQDWPPDETGPSRDENVHSFTIFDLRFTSHSQIRARKSHISNRKLVELCQFSSHEIHERFNSCAGEFTFATR